MTYVAAYDKTYAEEGGHYYSWLEDYLERLEGKEAYREFQERRCEDSDTTRWWHRWRLKALPYNAAAYHRRDRAPPAISRSGPFRYTLATPLVTPGKHKALEVVRESYTLGGYGSPRCPQ